MKNRLKEVAVIGLGLMGGSFALSLKGINPECRITGYDHNDQHCIEALELNLVDRITDEISDLYDMDLIVLAIPVDGIISTLKELTDVSSHTTIMDLGSTKSLIVESVPDKIRKNFVATHPMTGTEKFGPSAAFAELYRGKAVVLCNIEDSGKEQRKLVKEIYGYMGMKIFYMDAKEHDRHAAFISHMPHALSYSLANAVMKQENPQAILALAGGGFRDMSRIAKSSPNMWLDIFRQNKSNLLEAIECLKDELNKCEEMVKKEEWERLREWMLNANELHNIL